MQAWKLLAQSSGCVSLDSPVEAVVGKFVGIPMKATWTMPSADGIEVRGRSGPIHDILSWGNSRPVFSERATRCLLDVVDEHVELLPLLEWKGSLYYAANVMTVLPDVVDLERSHVRWSSDDPPRPRMIWQTVFKPDARIDVPIFKVQEDLSHVFVTRPFVDAVIQHRLTGAIFADPAANNHRKAFLGEDMNVIPEAAFRARGFKAPRQRAQASMSAPPPSLPTPPSVRPLSVAEMAEVQAAVARGLGRVHASAEGAPEATILSIQSYFEAWRQNTPRPGAEEARAVAVELGAAWGAMIGASLGWTWVMVADPGREALAIVAPDRSRRVHPIEYFHGLASDPHHDVTVVLLYRMLQANQGFSPAGPGALLPVG